MFSWWRHCQLLMTSQMHYVGQYLWLEHLKGDIKVVRYRFYSSPHSRPVAKENAICGLITNIQQKWNQCFHHELIYTTIPHITVNGGFATDKMIVDLYTDVCKPGQLMLYDYMITNFAKRPYIFMANLWWIIHIHMTCLPGWHAHYYMFDTKWCYPDLMKFNGSEFNTDIFFFQGTCFTEI